MAKLNVVDVAFEGNGARYAFSDGSNANAIYKVRSGKLVYEGLTDRQVNAVRRFNNDADSSVRNDARMGGVGDTGSTSPFSQDTDGLVPGPTSADIASNRHLQADGTWVTPPSGGLSQYGGGTFTDSGDGANAGGRAVAGTIEVTGDGALAHGYVDGANATLTSSHIGSFAVGGVKSTGSYTGTVEATERGAFAFGYVWGNTANSLISAADYGAMAGGGIGYSGGTISALAPGAMANGYALNGSTITCTTGGFGGMARGRCMGGSTISVGQDGAFAMGYARSSSTINAADEGSMAFGYSTGSGSQIRNISNSHGGFARGHAEAGGIIQCSTAQGGAAFGKANGASAYISCLGDGGFAGGDAGAGETISAAANGSFQWGVGTNNTSDSFQVGANVFRATVAGAVHMGTLPTSNPSVAGQLWSNGGVLTVSSG